MRFYVSLVLPVLAFGLLAGTALVVRADDENHAEANEIAHRIVHKDVDTNEVVAKINASIKRKIDAETDPDKRDILQKRLGNNFFNSADVEQIVNAVAKLYTENFSLDELHKIETFKNSPMGMKLDKINKQQQGVIMATTLQVMGQKMQAIATKNTQ